MKNKEVKGILALVVVTALSFGVIIGSRSRVIIGSRSLAISAVGDSAAQSTEAIEELDVSGA